MLIIYERVSGKIMQNVKKCPEARFSNPTKLMFDGNMCPLQATYEQQSIYLHIIYKNAFLCMKNVSNV